MFIASDKKGSHSWMTDVSSIQCVLAGIMIWLTFRTSFIKPQKTNASWLLPTVCLAWTVRHISQSSNHEKTSWHTYNEFMAPCKLSAWLLPSWNAAQFSLVTRFVLDSRVLTSGHHFLSPTFSLIAVLYGLYYVSAYTQYASSNIMIQSFIG